MTLLDEERALIEATQGGLPLVPEPYAEVGRQIGQSEAEVMARLAGMVARGFVRRIAVAPNHFALGVTANGMSVWDVEDGMAEHLGAQVGALPFVSHCYLRPRALPDWPYNLFAMLHGASRHEVEKKAGEVAALLRGASRGHDILYSRRILKKTGLRLASGQG